MPTQRAKAKISFASAKKISVVPTQRGKEKISFADAKRRRED